jgi:hypothetical protein
VLTNKRPEFLVGSWLSQLRMLLQDGDRLMRESKATLALVKDAEDNHFAQFQKEMDSMKKMTNVENKRRTKFWDEMESM